MSENKYSSTPLWELGFQTIKELEIEQGILASSRSEIYGCIFGRDSLLTALKLLKAYDLSNDEYFLRLVKKILTHMFTLQGKEVNIESGEQPGKCIHEFRSDNHEHLTKHASNPWFLYPDNVMRNYDSVDATFLLLIATYRYWQKSGDEAFLQSVLDKVKLSLLWVLAYSDSNGDGFVDYQLSPERTFGGLITQSWMDSKESVFHENLEAVEFPIAPVEVQAYSYLALRLWGKYYRDLDAEFHSILFTKAKELKENFNNKFVFAENSFVLASGLDGAGKPLLSARSSLGHCLWASLRQDLDGERDCILKEEYIPFLAQRLMEPDLFEPKAGIRTLSTTSVHYAANSYHNGSIWPHDNSLIIEGLQAFGFYQEAWSVRQGILKSLEHFQTPIELFVYDWGEYSEYSSPSGQGACKKQAWSAASMMVEAAEILLGQPGVAMSLTENIISAAELSEGRGTV